MESISVNEQEHVTGGFVQQFFAGYVASKAVDGLVESFGQYVEEFSVGDHSNSVRYFEENRENFNPLL